MRNLTYAVLVILLGAFILLVSPVPDRIAAQAGAPQTCEAVVQQALEALTANCTGVGRNTACYGNVQVNGTFSDPVPEGYFTQPADTAEIVTLRSLVTSPMDVTNDIWGVALMNVQANLPGALPGQSVTMILMGDTVVGNAVPADEAALPVVPVQVTTVTPADIRTLPETTAEIAGTVDAGTVLEADARTPDNAWLRVSVLTQPIEDAFGGWVSSAQVAPFDMSALPVVDTETRTPMQAFVFRTGIGAPTCAEAPSSLVVQGPNNTQVLMNVNGADLSIGSTVTLTSVNGAPDEILDTLDLPDEVVDQLGDADDAGEDQCGVMAMSVISGEVEVNDGGVILPEGNTAFAVYCEEPPPEGSPEETPEPGSETDLFNVDFSSDWGAFQPMTEEELESLSALEEIGDDILNYPIVLPDPDEIQPPIIVTPTPTAVALGVTSTPSPTLTPTIPPTPTNTPIPPGTGLSTNLTVDTAANNQIVAVGQPLAVPFSVTVTDPYGGASIGVPVTFTAPASAASGTFAATGTTTQTVNTNQSGVATASAFTTNTVAGSYTITVSAPRDVGFFALGTGKDSFGKPAAQATLLTSLNVTNAPGAPALIGPAPGGSDLTATVNTVYAAQPAALITDMYGNPVPFVPVTFNVIPVPSGASGDFSGSSTANGVTGFDGIASAPFLTANTAAGSFPIDANGGFASVGLVMTNLPDVPATLTAVTGGQSTTVATTFASPLVANVTDAYGNDVPSVSVTFSAPGSGASATFSGTGTASETVITDGAGNAISSTLTANTVAGSYGITASSGAFSDTFGMTNTAGAPASLIVTGGNGQSTVLNSAFASPLSVSVSDTYGNPAAGASVTFTPPGSGASGTFSGSATVAADGSGSATSPTFTANNVAGNYFVSVSSGAASGSVNLTNLNPQPVLTSVSPSSVTAGSGGFTLTLSGSSFVPGMVVTWSGQPNLTATVLTSNSATASVPGSYIALPGSVTVGVSNPGPGGGPSSGSQTSTVNPSTVVTSLADSGPGSLRQIIADVPAGSTITFGVSGTITLTSGAISLNKNLTINGSNPYQVTISGNSASRIFNIGGAGTSIAIYGIRIINGYAGGGDGGAIYVNPGTTLNLQYSVMENNVAGTSGCCGKGGAMFIDNANVNIFNSSLRNNQAGTDISNNYGGAITLYNGGTVAVTQSCLTGNVDAAAPNSNAISNMSGSTLNATDNWWGNAGGPGVGGANTVSGSVTTAPFRTAPVPSVVDC